MKLFSYVVAHDCGFAPNPFFGWCTLACCKPKIRKEAVKDDWIVGLTPKKLGNDLVYAMQVQETMPFDQYWRDRRFKKKRPTYDTGQQVDKCGDNIYRPDPSASLRFRQLKSYHSRGCCENATNKKHDLNGENVLVSRHYVYFGSKAIALPPEFKKHLKVERGHKCNSIPEEVVTAFNRWANRLISRHKAGRHGQPRDWDRGDSSCRKD